MSTFTGHKDDLYRHRGPGLLQPESTITVSDAERLAKAGVKIDFAAIAGMLVPDPPPSSRHGEHIYRSELTDMLFARYMPGWRQRNGGFASDGREFPFQFWATAHGDKVCVYVAPKGGREPVILVDESVIFPSDTLIASICLLEKCK